MAKKPVDAKNPAKSEGRPILCVRCGQGGGTLVKVGDRYQHQHKCPPKPIIKEPADNLQKQQEVPSGLSSEIAK